MVALAWLSPTGGWRYHLRAWRYRPTIWKPYLDEIGAWLSGWQPPERSLLVVGPSGGYSLPATWLSRFENIAAVEPDPIARWIFRRRFGASLQASRTALQFVRGDYFSPGPDGYSIDRWHALLDRFPGHAVLFSNFLGQMSLLDARDAHFDSLLRWFEALPGTLGGRSFASYHDRFSGSLRPRTLELLSSNDVIDNDELGAQVYVSALKRRNAVDVADHGTGALFPGHPRRFVVWQIVPGFWHLIEAVAVTWPAQLDA